MSNLDGLELVDDEGDRLLVESAGLSGRPDELFLEALQGVYLTREHATRLRNHLTEWLGEPVQRDLHREARAEAMLSSAETVKATGGTVEIAGVKIERCDEYGRTDADLVRLANEPTRDRAECCEQPATILQDALAAVYGDRQDDYGHPRQNFTRTAIGWHMVLLDKLAEGEHITPEDVALCMVQVKVAREVHEPKRDNRVDGAGYFEVLDRLETGR